jgi:serine/threonine protein kinase/tetratricopeptide (TPR) repeat protein
MGEDDMTSPTDPKNLQEGAPVSGGDATLNTAGSGGASPGRSKERVSIGPYVLVKKLGEGGMGQVWLVEQTAPVKRQVALKLIKGGMYDSSVLLRFESERQSLAIMNHPAIAKVFDAGSTADGQPYFVMEYVDGLPITRYSDNKKLTIGERIELFIKVCEGVQHAHQKAVIHRDLKPSNVLVSEVDGKPVPRIIDFGIAKAISSQTGVEHTVFTQIGALVGTPGFMSPEQADPSVLDVDTRTDVYSLGVILYALLTGTQPFDVEQWRKKPLDQVLRQLREEDPPTPSARLSDDSQSTTDTAAKRCTEPKQLVNQLRGDLDWITMKAVEKDRARRYGTPMELAADLERYLQNQPVLARPAGAGYRMRKYVQRHRLGVAVAAGAAALLVAFGVAQSVELRRVTRERDRADRITRFMTGMFKVSDPSEARGNSVTAREILDKASTDIDVGLKTDPQLQAKLMFTMGQVYLGMGVDARGQSLLEQALQIQRTALGDQHRDTLETATLLSTALRYRGHYPEAEKLTRETLQTQRKVLGPQDRDTLESMSGLANVLAAEGHDEQAEKIEREVLATRQRLLGSQHPDTLVSMQSLSITMRREGRFKEAETLQRQVLDTQRRTLGLDHPATLSTMTSLGNTLSAEADFSDAEKLFREQLETNQRVFGPDHPNTLTTKINLANALTNEGHPADAEKLQREIVAADTRTLGPDHPATLLAKSNLSFTLGNENRLADSEKLQREVIATGRRVLGPEHPQVLNTMNGLARNLQREGRFTEAEKEERDVLEIERRTLGPDKPSTLEAMNYLGETLTSEGHYRDAEKVQRDILQAVNRVFGPTHPNTLGVMADLGDTLEKEGQYPEAEKLHRDSLENVRRNFGSDSQQTVESIEGLAICLSYEKKYGEAKALFAEALQTTGKVKDAGNPAGAWYSWASGAALAGHPDEALEHLRQAVEAGYQDADGMSKDEDLKSLRGKPEFRELVAQARQHAAAARAPTKKPE